jgi:Flp pilus assembly protein TadG
VEFAFVAPVFLIFVLGIFEVGRGMMVQHLLQSAARQGCRAGILPSNGNTEIANTVSDALRPAGITSQTVSVTVNDVTANANTANTNDDVTVNVTVPANSISWVPGTRYLLGNITAQYTLRKQ